MRVLFVCTGNSFRSPAAEALTRLHHPELEVESRGTSPADHIAEPTIQYCRERGAAEFLKPGPEQVNQAAVDRADLVVCMMPEHREYLERKLDLEGKEVEVWKIRDGILPDVVPREQLEKIESRVRQLA